MKIQNNSRRTLHMPAVLALAAGLSFAASWTRINNGLPSVSIGAITLAVDPSNSSIVYAFSGGTIFKSAVGGAEWQPITSLGNVYSMTVDSQGIIYATTFNVILKSSDGGESWTGASSGLVGLPTRVFVDPVTPSTLYVILLPPGGGVPTSGVYKSTNSGASWTVLNNAPRNTSWLVVDPKDPSTIYASNQTGSALFKTTDGGENWAAFDASLPVNSPVIILAVAPSDPSTIYVASRNPATRLPAISKSTDSGKGWTLLDVNAPAGASIRTLKIHPADASTVYLVYSLPTAAGLLRTTDGGATWEELGDGLPSGATFRALEIDPVSPDIIYAAYADDRAGTGGLWKSTNSGISWNRADTGLSVMDVRMLATDPVNGSTLYTGGKDLFKSIDYGDTWTSFASFQLPAASFPPPSTQPAFGAGPAHIRSMLIDFSNPNILYVGTARYNACIFSDKLLFKSVDGGVTWTDTVSPPTSGCRLTPLMVLDPSDPNTIYAAEFDDGDWLRKSTDGGRQWRTIADFGTGLESGLYALAIDPKNPNILYAGVGDASSYKPGTSATGVIKSADGGRTWANIGLQGNTVTLLVIDPSDSAVLYAATEGNLTTPRGFRGLYKSGDGGANWVAINDGLEKLIDARSRINALVIHRNNRNVLYAASSGGGVARSTDGGATWHPFNHGLSNLDVRFLTRAADDSNTLYGGTTSGVFRIADDLR